MRHNRIGRWLLSVGLSICVVGGATSAWGDDGKAAGRRHANKANQLAAQNKCKQAVAEFTKAYRALKDPTLLFNRAECERKIGENGDAIRDYDLFLSEMPKAPNRAAIEARIKALRESDSARAGRGGARGKKANSALGDNSDKSDDEAAGANGSPDHAGQSGARLPNHAAHADLGATENLTTRADVPEPPSAEHSHAWVWVGAAVVVVAAGAFAAYHFWPRSKTDVPSTALGNYAF